MFDVRSAGAWSAGLLAATVTAGLVGAGPAAAISGGSPADVGSYGFAVRLQIGEQAACTGALVDPSWVVTATSCFATNSQPVVAGPPAQQTLVTVGRTDLTSTAGHAVPVVHLVPRSDRDVVLARLATPVPDVAPVEVGATAAAPGELLRVAGYGRTATEWVPDRLHTAVFSVAGSTATTLDIAAHTPGEASLCKGDAGGPGLREAGGQVRLVAVTTASWQGGCLGVPETRRGATQARLDDIADWITQQTRPRTLRLRNAFSKRCLVALGRENANSAPVRQFDCAPFADQSWVLEPSAEHAGGYQFRNLHSGRCLVALARENVNDGPVRQFDCAPFADQVWDIAQASGGIQLRNRFSQRCLLVSARDNVNSAPAVQFDCAPYADQIWQVEPVDTGGHLRNAHTKRCLVALASENVNAAPVRQFDCAGYADQLWTMQPVPGGYQIRNRHSDRCLVVVAAENANGAPARQFDCAGYADQIWELALSGGGFQVRNRHSGRCLTVSDDNANAASVIQRDCADVGVQHWEFRPVPQP